MLQPTSTAPLSRPPTQNQTFWGNRDDPVFTSSYLSYERINKWLLQYCNALFSSCMLLMFCCCCCCYCRCRARGRNWTETSNGSRVVFSCSSWSDYLLTTDDKPGKVRLKITVSYRRKWTDENSAKYIDKTGVKLFIFGEDERNSSRRLRF